MLLYIVAVFVMWLFTVVAGTKYMKAYYNKNDIIPDEKKHKIFLAISAALVLVILGNVAAACAVKNLGWLNIPIIAMVCGITLYEAEIDAKLHLIPNMLVLVQLIGWVVIVLMRWIIEKADIITLLISSLIGGGGACLFFLLARLLSKGGVGMGDVKLITIMGLYLGINGIIGMLLYSLICSFIYGLFMLITRKGKLKTEVAMAPFFFIGAVVYTAQQIWM